MISYGRLGSLPTWDEDIIPPESGPKDPVPQAVPSDPSSWENQYYALLDEYLTLEQNYTLVVQQLQDLEASIAEGEAEAEAEEDLPEARELLGQLQDAGWRQVDLAQALGVSDAAVSRWVAGNRTPSQDIVPTLQALRDIHTPGTVPEGTPPVEQILAQLKEAGLRQEDIATELGVTRSAVSQWRTGRRQPSPSTLLALQGLLKDATKKPGRPLSLTRGQRVEVRRRWEELAPSNRGAFHQAEQTLADEFGVGVGLIRNIVSPIRDRQWEQVQRQATHNQVVALLDQLVEKGWTTSQVAHALGVSQGSVASWKREGRLSRAQEHLPLLQELLDREPAGPTQSAHRVRIREDRASALEALQTLLEQGWTVQQVGAQLNVRESVVQKWVSGQSTPQWKFARQLLELLDSVAS